MRKRVAEAEAKVEEFRAKTNLFIGTNGTTLSSQTLGESNRDLAAARSQKADLEVEGASSSATCSSAAAPLEFSDMINSELIRRLNEQRVTLARAARRAVVHAARQPSAHQGAEGADRRRSTARSATRRSGSRVRSRTMRASPARGSSRFRRQPRPAQAAGGVHQRAGRQLRALEREAKAQRDLLESYLAKYREATARDSLGAVPSDARIISRAAVSNTPYFPKKLPIVLIATLATLFISAGFITTGELLAGNVYRRRRPVEPSWRRTPSSRSRADGGRSGSSRPRAGREAALAAGIVAQAEAGATRQRPRHRPCAAWCLPPHCSGRTTASPIADLAPGAARGGRGRQADRRHRRGAGHRHHADGGRAGARARRACARRPGRPRARAAEPCGRSRTDPRMPGIADLVRGTASFGQIITRDRYLARAGDPGRPRRGGCGRDRHRLRAAERSRSMRCRAPTTMSSSMPARRRMRSADAIARLAPCARAGRERPCGEQGGRGARPTRERRLQRHRGVHRRGARARCREHRASPPDRGGSYRGRIEEGRSAHRDGGAVFHRRPPSAASAARRRRRDPDAASRAPAARATRSSRTGCSKSRRSSSKTCSPAAARATSTSSRSTRCTGG